MDIKGRGTCRANWYVVRAIAIAIAYISLWYVHVHIKLWSVQSYRYMHIPRSVQRSVQSYRYVHVPNL